MLLYLYRTLCPAKGSVQRCPPNLARCSTRVILPLRASVFSGKSHRRLLGTRTSCLTTHPPVPLVRTRLFLGCWNCHYIVDGGDVHPVRLLNYDDYMYVSDSTRAPNWVEQVGYNTMNASMKSVCTWWFLDIFGYFWHYYRNTGAPRFRRIHLTRIMIVRVVLSMRAGHK